MEVVKYFYTQAPSFNYHVVAASAHGVNMVTRVHDDVIFIVERGRKRV